MYTYTLHSEYTRAPLPFHLFVGNGLVLSVQACGDALCGGLCEVSRIINASNIRRDFLTYPSSFLFFSHSEEVLLAVSKFGVDVLVLGARGISGLQR